MQVAIDIRPLLESRRSGVGNYTTGIVRAVLRLSAAKKPGDGPEFKLWGNAYRGELPKGIVPAGTDVGLTRWPNKILHLCMAAAGRPTIGSLAGGADLVYLPNLHFADMNCPYAVTVHDLSFVRFPHFFSPRQRLRHAAIRPKRLLERAAAVIAVSAHTKADIIETYGIPAGRISVVPPAADTCYRPLPREAVAQALRRHGVRGRYFLCVGTIEPRKNLTTAIEAFERLTTDAILLIIGQPGYRADKIKTRARASVARDRIRFLDYVPAEDLPAFYNGAIALVYPSFYEGFGMPTLEAMACGTPVIASHVTSLSEVVGSAGLLVDPYRAADTADAMAALQDDARLRADLTRRGLERAAAYGWDNSAEKLLSLFREFRS